VTGSLTASDIAMFKAIGVTEHTAAQLAQVRRVTHQEALDVCGVRYKSDHLEGLAFPYLDPETDQPCTWRVRRDHPEQESDGTPIAKYVSPPDRRHLYFAPSCYAQLADVSAPAIIVEAEKSVLSIMDAEVHANRPRGLYLALGGCWLAWRHRQGDEPERRPRR
jgi:hypothetical protein